MCDIDVGKCCDIDVQEQAIELLIRNMHCTSTTRCKIHYASRADEVSQPRSAGLLVWVTSNMDSALVVSKP